MSKATKKEANEEIVTAAFGQKNRVRLLDEYFTSRPVPTAATAWSHVYQLLVDRPDDGARALLRERQDSARQAVVRTLVSIS